MYNTLVIKDEKVENGVYVVGYLLGENNKEEKVGYKCFIPYIGKLARVPEMSRYFFFTQLKNNNVSKVVVSSEYCDKFIHDEIYDSNEYNINGYYFEKAY